MIKKGGEGVKKISNLFFLFILANTAVLSLGLECFWGYYSTVMWFSLDGYPFPYPRFRVFCIVLGIVCLLALIALFVLNFKAYAKYNFKASVWAFEYIITFVLSLPMVMLWEMLFNFLREVF